jgi:hypothetical protein
MRRNDKGSAKAVDKNAMNSGAVEFVECSETSRAGIIVNFTEN